ncbi:hypothetical protein KTJ16_20460 [Acinetobacter bereziniae]|uniref:hypothetical protein n=1 Tax=Acinetobacter TaxID=469 RepID=UPI000EF67D43|nr:MULTISPECIES: hypothetical protein [Acinetobacter]MBJ8420444.1 hypothetical protein [Acinetobacter bereziniae]MCU4476134.1 hypothetical protein [Acinetobacter bereziniae]MCU4543523.1 hypothetical protein [Acinetobacter bereziniae]MCU4624244.1 hypothetical protein [Acinetobacter bereziniae]BCX73342.1 hypothetical protein TOL5_15420 [Acinetobacter sp. Tol 5]
MNIFNKTLTMSGTGAKAPVKIAIKTNYRITIMVNDNTVILGTHAGMLLIGPNTFEIYDPNGSFHYPGISGGSLGLVPVDDLGKQHDVFKKYLEYQLINGERVYLYSFYVSRKEFYQIEENILNQVGCGPVLNCTQCTSGAISGVGIFKNIPSGIFLPSNLKKEMDKISKPLKIITGN